jgi:hypothetical protein
VERTLFSDAYVTVTIDDDAALVRYRRSREPYTSLETLRELNAKLQETFDALPSGTLSLLIDVREAPPRNDDAFESEIVGTLQAMAGRFIARATLVRTAVGRLQVQRIARARTGQAIETFSDEVDALAYLVRRK